VIVHCAALTNVDECEKSPEASKIQNVTATQNVAALAKACGAQLVYMSTDYVFDGAAGPYSEDAVPSPRSVYGQHKLDSEAIALAASTSIVLRITNVYGEEPRGKNFVARIAANAQKSVNGEPMTLKLPSDQIATPIDAADVRCQSTTRIACFLVHGELRLPLTTTFADLPYLLARVSSSAGNCVSPLPPPLPVSLTCLLVWPAASLRSMPANHFLRRWPLSLSC
jgi:hypothetical protein